jgi:hypothetical protein
MRRAMEGHPARLEFRGFPLGPLPQVLRFMKLARARAVVELFAELDQLRLLLHVTRLFVRLVD